MSHSGESETTVPDPVLTAERAHLARAAECLTEMRTAASAAVDAGVDAWASERLGAARAERLSTWPRGLTRRRRFGFAGGELTGYEDEVLAEWLTAHPDEGPGNFLREEIERPRSGPMRDIVATIQPDQDDIVRAPLAESICVQGPRW